jgi:hypothetical protein
MPRSCCGSWGSHLQVDSFVHDLSLTHISLTPAASRTHQTSLCTPACSHPATDKPSTEKLEVGTAQSTKDYPDKNALAVPSSTIATTVPGFWLIAPRNHVGLSELITNRDAGACNQPTYLLDTEVGGAFTSPGSSSSLSFHETNILK